jgi:hypothetical protein
VEKVAAQTETRNDVARPDWNAITIFIAFSIAVSKSWQWWRRDT